MRARALKTGQKYLQILGFNGFSFQTISDALGIRKASLHYYFASKQDMGRELLEDYEKQFIMWSEKILTLSAYEKILKFIKIFTLMSEDHLKICPSGALCADFNSLDKSTQRQLLQFHQTQKRWLVETFEQGQKEKTVRKDIHVEAVADLWMASIQGGLQIARLRGDPSYFKKLSKNLLEELFFQFL